MCWGANAQVRWARYCCTPLWKLFVGRNKLQTAVLKYARELTVAFVHDSGEDTAGVIARDRRLPAKVKLFYSVFSE